MKPFPGPVFRGYRRGTAAVCATWVRSSALARVWDWTHTCAHAMAMPTHAHRGTHAQPCSYAHTRAHPRTCMHVPMSHMHTHVAYAHPCTCTHGHTGVYTHSEAGGAPRCLPRGAGSPSSQDPLMSWLRKLPVASPLQPEGPSGPRPVSGWCWSSTEPLAECSRFPRARRLILHHLIKCEHVKEMVSLAF